MERDSARLRGAQHDRREVRVVDRVGERLPNKASTVRAVGSCHTRQVARLRLEAQPRVALVRQLPAPRLPTQEIAAVELNT